MIVVDIWSGTLSQDHVARFIEPIDQAMITAKKEIEAGNLVNLRQAADFGPDQSFDSRIGGVT